MTNILDSLSSNFLTVTLKGTGGWSPNAKIKGAEHILASHFGGDDRAFRGTENILPTPYNKEFTQLTKAFNAYRSAFYDLTMPFAHTTDPKSGKAQADGTRLLAARLLANGKFINTLAALEQDLDQARAACASTIAIRVQEIANDGVLGSRFDPSRYPTSSDILVGWRYEPIVPIPLADGSRLRGMSIPGHMLTAIEQQMEAAATSQIKFGQQSLVEDLVANIKTMAANLTKLDDWFANQSGRRPAIYDTLVTNLQESLVKLRTYVLPNTPQGDKLLALADEIEARLDVGSLKADDFKTDHHLTRRVARDADKLATQLTASIDALFDGTDAPPAFVTRQVDPTPEPTAAPVTEAPKAQAPQEDLDALLAEWV